MIDAQFDETVSDGQTQRRAGDGTLARIRGEARPGQLEPMNLSKHVRDTRIPKLGLQDAASGSRLQDGMRKEQVDSDTAAIETQSQTTLSAGRTSTAPSTKVDDMIRCQTDQRRAARQEDAGGQDGYDEWRATTDITAAPREALPDLEKATQTGKSETYKHLPISSLSSLRNFAKSEIERKETESLNSIANQVATNKIKTPEEIDAAAGGNVEARKLVPLKNHLNQDDPLQPGVDGEDRDGNLHLHERGSGDRQSRVSPDPGRRSTRRHRKRNGNG